VLPWKLYSGLCKSQKFPWHNLCFSHKDEQNDVSLAFIATKQKKLSLKSLVLSKAMQNMHDDSKIE